MDDVKPDVLKDLYEELGKNFRHFLTWRRLLFAGYFAVLAGLNLALANDVETKSFFSPTLPVAIAMVTVVFWALDWRNRGLIHIASTAGRNLEQQLGLGDAGIYTVYEQQGGGWLTHTSILTTFYTVVFIAAVLLTFIH